MTPASPRTVLLVEDHPLMRALVERSLQDDGFVVESVGTSRRAIREFEAIDPDVLVTDIDLGDRPNGVELATLLRAQAPYLGVVFLTNYTSIDAIAGSVTPPEHAAFVHKGSVEQAGQLRQAIDSALDDTTEALVLAAKGNDDPVARLSATQLSVLKQIAEGWNNAEIAAQRGVTLRSAERLITRTFETLGVNNDDKRNARVLATRLYIRAYGVPEPPRPRSPRP
ncbi:MAG: response regulator transcription factor [Actinomycetales bacterium]|nr:response regulator transcription factor [Actinomycetales bacterium]